MSIKLMILIAFFIALLLAFAVYMLFFNKPQKSGFIYSKTIDDTKELFSELQAQNKSAEKDPLIYFAPMGKRALNNDPWRENALAYTVPSEERGLVLGISGSGKTTYLVSQLVSWMQTGKSFVVTDIKPEIWAILHVNGVLERYGYDLTIINPTDAKADKYNAFDDIDDDKFVVETNELINILIGGREFGGGAKLLLQAVLLHLKQIDEEVSLNNAISYLRANKDIDDTIEDLQDSDNKHVRDLISDLIKMGANERFIGSCYNALRESLSFLLDDTIVANTSSSDVSLRDVLQKPKQAVFLQFEQEYQQQTAGLFGFTLAHVLRLLQVDFKNRDDVFIAIDEIINSAPIPNLAQKLNTMRSAKMPLFMYLQTLSGLDDVYGANASKLFMSACSLKICYRVNDNATAQEFSRLVGDVDVKRWSTTETPQVTDTGRSYTQRSINEQIERKPLIEPSAFGELATGDAVVIYKGKSAQITMPRYYEVYPMLERPDFGTISEFYQSSFYEPDDDVDDDDLNELIELSDSVISEDDIDVPLNPLDSLDDELDVIKR